MFLTVVFLLLNIKITHFYLHAVYFDNMGL